MHPNPVWMRMPLLAYHEQKGEIHHEADRRNLLVFRQSGSLFGRPVFYRLSEGSGTFSFYLINRQHQFNRFCGDRHTVLSFVFFLLPSVLFPQLPFFAETCSPQCMFYFDRTWVTALFYYLIFNGREPYRRSILQICLA